ncbi:MAG: hypothetical protein QG670_1772 [Thermoproteota archaeon]|nr:hypothetical protein [Thermoproteota archaeon]
MHLYSVVEGFDGKGKGQGYELSIMLSSTDVNSGDNNIALMILVVGIVITTIVIVGALVKPRVRDKYSIWSWNKIRTRS